MWYHAFIPDKLPKVHEIHSKIYDGEQIDRNEFPTFNTNKHSQGEFYLVVDTLLTNADFVKEGIDHSDSFYQPNMISTQKHGCPAVE